MDKTKYDSLMVTRDTIGVDRKWASEIVDNLGHRDLFTTI